MYVQCTYLKSILVYKYMRYLFWGLSAAIEKNATSSYMHISVETESILIAVVKKLLPNGRRCGKLPLVSAWTPVVLGLAALLLAAFLVHRAYRSRAHREETSAACPFRGVVAEGQAHSRKAWTHAFELRSDICCKSGCCCKLPSCFKWCSCG